MAGLVGLLGMAICAPLLLPRGTFAMRRGLPSVMLSRFFLPGAFFGTITYVPLMLTGERGFTLARAGTVLAVGSIGFRHTRAGQMARQYRWLYERPGPLTWREKHLS